MKCITVRQPYAFAIVSDQKNIENRSRPTKYRGPILIHAAKARCTLDREIWVKGFGTEPPELAFGAVVGIADLVDCLPVDHPSLKDNEWAKGPWCYVLANRRAFETPIPAQGQLGIYSVKQNVIMAVESQL